MLLYPWDSPGKRPKWVAMPSSRDWTCISYVSCIVRWVLYHQHHLGSPVVYGFFFFFLKQWHVESFVAACEIFKRVIPLLSFWFEWLLFLFVGLVSLARTSSTVLKRRGKSGHPCLVLDLGRKSFAFSLLSMMFAVGFYCIKVSFFYT